jgi:hypothetical protein
MKSAWDLPGVPFEERMTKQLIRWGLAGLAALVLASAVSAQRPRSPLEVAFTDAVVIGKVISLSKRLVPGKRWKGDTRPMQIATVQVEEVLWGTKRKEIQVATLLRLNQPRMYPRTPRDVRLPSYAAVLLMVKHPTQKDLYLVQSGSDIIVRAGNPKFAAQLEQVKKGAEVLANPMKYLKSKDARDRFLATAMLLKRYRNAPRQGPEKTEPVPATESRLLLTTLAEADWDNDMRFPTPIAGFLFRKLRLTEENGWKPREDGTPFDTQAKAWLKANARKYRIQRYVGTAVDSSLDPKP